MGVHVSSWFITSPSKPQARLRLFAVPHAGRGASLFFPWRTLVPDWMELVAIQLPGREGRLSEPAMPRLDSIVAALTSEIWPRLDMPYALFGHSMGALVCFELARALRRAGAPAPVALALSGRRAPTVPSPDPPLHLLSDSAFIDAMRMRYGGIPQVVLEQPDLLQLLLPTLRRDIEAIETHEYRPEPPFPSPFLLYAGQEDRQAPVDAVAAWGALSTRPSPVRVFPGGHFFVQDERAALAQVLCDDVKRLSAA